MKNMIDTNNYHMSYIEYIEKLRAMFTFKQKDNLNFISFNEFVKFVKAMTGYLYNNSTDYEDYLIVAETLIDSMLNKGCLKSKLIQDGKAVRVYYEWIIIKNRFKVILSYEFSPVILN